MLKTLGTGEDDLSGAQRAAGKLVAGVSEAARANGIAITSNQVAACLPGSSPITRSSTGIRPPCNTELFGRFHRGMLDAGVWLPPSQFEAAFLSTAHTATDIDTPSPSRAVFAGIHDNGKCIQERIRAAKHWGSRFCSRNFSASYYRTWIHRESIA